MTEALHRKLLLTALDGSEAEQLMILNQELPRDVLEALVDGGRASIAMALVSAQHDLPQALVSRLEEAERERLKAGNSIGADQLLGNLDHATTEFRLKMMLEDIKFERLRDAFDDLHLPEQQRQVISDRKRSGHRDETVAEAIAATAVAD